MAGVQNRAVVAVRAGSGIHTFAKPWTIESAKILRRLHRRRCSAIAALGLEAARPCLSEDRGLSLGEAGSSPGGQHEGLP